jgi:hypothetical protein
MLNDPLINSQRRDMPHAPAPESLNVLLPATAWPPMKDVLTAASSHADILTLLRRRAGNPQHTGSGISSALCGTA